MPYPTLAPSDTWFTQGGTTVKRASITEIEIKNSYAPVGTPTASWDASAAKDGSIMAYVEGTKLTIAGNGSGMVYANPDSSWVFSDHNKADYFNNVTNIKGAELLNTSKATTFERLFESCEKLASVNVSNWDTGCVTNMFTTFSKCYALKNLDVSNWETGNVKTMRSTFQVCLALESLELSKWDVHNVETFQGMFMSSSGAMNLTTIGDTTNWNTGACTTMQTMFQNCASLKKLYVSNWDVSNVISMKNMFYECTSLEELDVSNWDVSKVTTFSGMFRGVYIKELDVSNWSTPSATDMSAMFYMCNNIKIPLDVSNWDVSNVTTFDHMTAHSGIVLNGVENWRTPSAVNMNAMFHCIGNTVIDVSNLDTSNVQFFCQMFENSGKLTHIIGLENFDTSNGIGFDGMFERCVSLKELNLSSFDTRKAKDGVTCSTNGSKTATLNGMFYDTPSLEKITLGPNFSPNGDGTTTNTSNHAILPTTNDGYWYDINENAYEPSAVFNLTHRTYYASKDAMQEDADRFVLVKNGSLMRTAEAIRSKSGKTSGITPSEFAEILASQAP